MPGGTGRGPYPEATRITRYNGFDAFQADVFQALISIMLDQRLELGGHFGRTVFLGEVGDEGVDVVFHKVGFDELNNYK